MALAIPFSGLTLLCFPTSISNTELGNPSVPDVVREIDC